MLVALPTSWGGDCVIDGVATIKGIECLLTNILRTILPLGGMAVGVMIVVAGFQLILSGGEPEGFKKAKATFTYAVGGLVVLVLVWFVLVFVENFTGVRVTEFRID